MESQDINSQSNIERFTNVRLQSQQHQRMDSASSNQYYGDDEADPQDDVLQSMDSASSIELDLINTNLMNGLINNKQGSDSDSLSSISAKQSQLKELKEPFQLKLPDLSSGRVNNNNKSQSGQLTQIHHDRKNSTADSQLSYSGSDEPGSATSPYIDNWRAQVSQNRPRDQKKVVEKNGASTISVSRQLETLSIQDDEINRVSQLQNERIQK
ncbi:hypothetical protein MP228_007251 [Amoeboaphelidium protococcarum]|nr:hypothetical protein MP228_007251 [Amoeboaphelidium protococcarum]